MSCVPSANNSALERSTIAIGIRLYAMLSRAGVDVIDMGVVRDTRDAVASALSEAAANADVVITSGGVVRW